MKVIFVKDVKGQGKCDEIKEVSSGYGLNFLIKNGYAVAYNDSNLKQLKRKLDNSALQENLLIQECEILKEKIDKITLIFKVKTGKYDKVFGAVTSKQISDELSLKDLKVDKRLIKAHEINTLGLHNVEVILHKKVIAILKVKLEKDCK